VSVAAGVGVVHAVAVAESACTENVQRRRAARLRLACLHPGNPLEPDRGRRRGEGRPGRPCMGRPSSEALRLQQDAWERVQEQETSPCWGMV
jgi:hypothetical protein